MIYTKWLTRTIVLAMVLMIAGTASAGNSMGKGGRHGPGHDPKGFPFLKRLDLTGEQRTQVRDILSAHREEMQSYADRMMSARQTLTDAMEAAPLDESAVRAAHNGLADVREEMTVLRARTIHEIKGILTPEQNARFTQMRAERRKRMKERMERRRERIEERLTAGPDAEDGWDAE